MEENTKRKHADHKKNDYAWGAFLLFIGVTLLFNSLNIIPWEAWGYILRFWPIFIILAGLSIIFDSSRYFRWVLGLLALAVYALIMLMVLNRYDEGWNNSELDLPQWIENLDQRLDTASDGEKLYDTFDLSSQFDLFTDYDINIKIAASEFTITESFEVDRVVIESSYFENWGKPIILLEEKEDVLEVNFDQDSDPGIFRLSSKTPSYDFLLGENILIKGLDIDMGAGRGVIDLSTVDIENLTADVGAGQLDVTLRDPIDESKYRFDVGAGDVKLTIPKDVNYVLTYSLGVGKLTVNGEDISRFAGDGRYEFDEADTDMKIEIDVNVGVGSFELSTDNFSNSKNV